MHEHHNWDDSYSGKATDHEEPDPLIVEIIDELKPGRALDIGCGAGGLVVALAQRGWRVTGIDITPKAIAAATKVLARRGVDAELEVADATRWTPTGAFDLVTSSFALPGDKDGRASVLAMARAALAPGGSVVIKDFDPSMERVEGLTGYDMPSIDELTTAFAGLEILRAEVVGTPPHDHDGSGAHAGESWTAAILHARRG